MNSDCILTCPNGYYAKSDSKTCELCSANCETCNDNESNCLSCSAGKYIMNSNCIDTCPNGYFSLGSSCTKCDNTCENCDS